MKLIDEVIDSVIVIETEEENIKIVVDIPTGEIIHFEQVETTINQLATFMTKAKARYSKFLRSEKLNDFKI